jgi:hypothetical protein
MRGVRTIFRFFRLFWQRWASASPDAPDAPLIDPDEFSRLLRSGRKQDLETLAKRLSERQKDRVWSPRKDGARSQQPKI